MSTENRTAPETNVQTEPFMTNQVFAGSLAGARPSSGVVAPPESSRSAPAGSGSDDELEEETLWEGRYSSRNFAGRALIGVLLLAASFALVMAVWVFGYTGLRVLAYMTGIGVVLYGLSLAYQLFRARRSHYYRLTTRRLFVTTGIFHRRVDQIELIRIKDLFVRQSLVGSWLNVGTVVLISSEQTLPKAYLLGIEDPRRVLDLTWRHTRLERDRRTTEVNPV